MTFLLLVESQFDLSEPYTKENSMNKPQADDDESALL